MKNILKKVMFALLSVILIISPIKSYAKEVTNDSDNMSSQSAQNLKCNEERLWIDHVYWTRGFIVSDLSVLRDRDDVLRRLLKNQEDIGNSIKPYYGEEAGNKLTALLKEHIIIAGQVIDAAKRNNKTDLDNNNKIWYKNADKIADFLSEANPNYDNKQLKDMLHTHLKLVTDQVLARLSANWKADIDAFDKGENHMINFADVLTEGIIKQFPEKFE